MDEKQKLKQKHHTTFDINQDLWDRFTKKVFERHGKTSGGALTRDLEEALELWLKQK